MRGDFRFRSKVCLANVMPRYYPESTALTPVRLLFNFLVLELGAGTHPKVGTSTLEHNVDRVGLRLVRYGLYFKPPEPIAVGFLTVVGLDCPFVAQIRGDLPEFTLNKTHKCIRWGKTSKKLKPCVSQYLQISRVLDLRQCHEHTVPSANAVP
jgi:hypothetical protein